MLWLEDSKVYRGLLTVGWEGVQLSVDQGINIQSSQGLRKALKIIAEQSERQSLVPVPNSQAGKNLPTHRGTKKHLALELRKK